MHGIARLGSFHGVPGRLPLLAAAVVSLLLHGALLVAFGKKHGVDDWAVGSRPGPTLAIRLVAAVPTPAMVEPMPPEQVAPASPAPSPVEPAVSRPVPRQEPQPQAPPATLAGTGPREPEMAPTLPAVAQSQPAQDGYLPRSQLTVPPRPVQDIVVPSTIEGVHIEGGRQVGVFTLFIDEDGTVRRTVVDGPTLAPVFQALAERTFLAARFVPGEVNGRPAKALIRVEVEFGEPAPGPPASVVSRQVLPAP